MQDMNDNEYQKEKSSFASLKKCISFYPDFREKPVQSEVLFFHVFLFLVAVKEKLRHTQQ